MGVIEGGNDKLQDYQTQLELLEQAGRKKKEEKETVTKQRLLDHSTRSDPVAMQKEPQESDETDASSKKPDRSTPTQEQPQEINVAQVTPMMPAPVEQLFQIPQNASQNHRMHVKRLGLPPADEMNASIHNALQAVTDQHFPRGINNINQVTPRQHSLGSNHALQDYQIQLMMLEQQNKKRLILARQDTSEQQFQEANANANAGALSEIQEQTPESSPSPHHHPTTNANDDAPTEFNRPLERTYSLSSWRVYVMREISPGTYQCGGMSLDEYEKGLREQQQQQQPCKSRL